MFLGCNQLGPSGALALHKGLLHNGVVKSVFLLSHMPFSSRNSPLLDLWLKRNRLGDEGLRHVVNLIEQNPTITVLDLVTNEFTGPVRQSVLIVVLMTPIQGLKCLSDLLIRPSCPLRILFLGGNTDAGPTGAAWIAAVRYFFTFLVLSQVIA